MAIASLILGIISIAFCWMPVIGLIVAGVCVVVTALMKRKKEYGKNKMMIKSIALIVAITGLVVSIFVTGVNVTESAIIKKTNEGALNDVKASVSAMTLAQAQQTADYAWNEARMKGLRNERMTQYIFNAISNSGLEADAYILEISKTGVIVKVR